MSIELNISLIVVISMFNLVKPIFNSSNVIEPSLFISNALNVSRKSDTSLSFNLLAMKVNTIFLRLFE